MSERYITIGIDTHLLSRNTVSDEIPANTVSLLTESLRSLAVILGSDKFTAPTDKDLFTDDERGDYVYYVEPTQDFPLGRVIIDSMALTLESERNILAIFAERQFIGVFEQIDLPFLLLYKFE